MIEGEIYKIKGQDYYVNKKLVNTEVILEKLNRFGKDVHSVTYLNRDRTVNERLKDCPLNQERIIIK